MMETWSIAVVLRATSNIAKIMGESASATMRANSVLSEHTRLLQKQRIAQASLAKATLMGGAAAAIGAGMVSGVKGAADLQMAMTTVGQATGATRLEMSKLQQQVLSLSDVTAQSASTIAQEMATAAKAGLNSFQRLHSAFPTIAKFADVQYFAAKASGRSLSPVEAVNIGTQFAHYFSAYSGQRLQTMLDTLNKIMFTQPEDINRLLNQGKYFIPLGRVLGLSMQQNMELLAAMGQVGFLRGRGGAGVENTLLGAINATNMTGHLQGARAKALRDLGILDSSGRNTLLDHGRLSWDKLTQALNAAAGRLSPVRYAQDLQAAFGKVSTQFLSVFSSPAVQSQLQFIRQAMGRMGSVEDFFNKFFNNLIPQIQRFGTNLMNLGINVMLPTLPMLTAGFRGMANVLQRIGDWFGNHPRAGLATAIGAFTATAALAAAAARQVWLYNDAILSTGRFAKASMGANVASGAEGGIGGFFAGLLARMRGILGLGAALRTTGGLYPEVEALMGGSVLGRLLGAIGSKIIPGVGWVLAGVTAVNAIVSVFTHLPAIATNVHNWWVKNQYQIGYTIGVAFSTIAKMLQNAIMGLVSGTGAAIQTFATNFWMMATPGGQVALAQKIAIEAAKAQQKWAAGPGSMTFGAGLQSGWAKNFPGNNVPARPVMEIHQPTFNFGSDVGPAKAKEHAHAVFQTLDELLRGSQQSQATTGVHYPVHPFVGGPALRTT